MLTQRLCAVFFVAILGFALVNEAAADPCGMVPPIYLGGSTPIARVGLQKTYVFFKDGVETFVIRPGFTGKVDEFGMLIPFPTPPALRKVPDEIFAHLDKAIDPPEVVVDLRTMYWGFKGGKFAKNIRRATHFLLRCTSKKGYINEGAGRSMGGSGMHGHGYATQVLALAYGGARPEQTTLDSVQRQIQCRRYFVQG